MRMKEKFIDLSAPHLTHLACCTITKSCLFIVDFSLRLAGICLCSHFRDSSAVAFGILTRMLGEGKGKKETGSILRENMTHSTLILTLFSFEFSRCIPCSSAVPTPLE